MANTFITPAIMARVILDYLYEQTVIAQKVYRNFDADFGGKQGDTITVRRPAQFEAKLFDRTAGIELQNIVETSFTVTLDTLLDVSFAITAEELTLEIAEWRSRFGVPAAQALLEGIETRIIENVLLDEAITNTVGSNASFANFDPLILVDAGKILNDNRVPKTDRIAAVTTRVEAEWLKDPLFHEADTRGDTEGIKDAMVGHKFGFDVLASTMMPDSGPHNGDSVAFHPSAAALVFRTLQKPEGVSPDQFEVSSYKGFGIRVVKDYDINKKQDVISFDVLMGTKLVDPTRAVRILGVNSGS
jgi:coat protein Gp5